MAASFFTGLSGLPRRRKFGFGVVAQTAPPPQQQSSASPAPGYYDLPGSGILPGGNLSVSPGKGGLPRSIPGIDIPVVGYPNTGWNPNDPLTGQYQNTILSSTRSDRGGAGQPLQPYDPMGYGTRPPNEDVMPTVTNNWLLNATNTDSTGNPLPTGGSYPDLSGLPPVNAVTGYPIPGYGGAPNTNPNTGWVQNARGGFARGNNQNRQGAFGYTPAERAAADANANQLDLASGFFGSIPAGGMSGMFGGQNWRKYL